MKRNELWAHLMEILGTFFLEILGIFYGDLHRHRCLKAELIFVTNITNYICEKKCHVEKFWEFLEKCWEILRNVGKFFGRFCHNLRAFMWRKIEPKNTFVEKK